MRDFIDLYYLEFSEVLNSFISQGRNKETLAASVNLLQSIKDNNQSVFIIGNGGSASIADHFAIDFTKNAGIRAYSLSGAASITTYANDFGYAEMFSKALEHHSRQGDLLIAISGTGTSPNILNACDYARRNSMHVLTFSGFNENNELSKKGDYNFWVDTSAFGYLEIIHSLLIHSLCDGIIGKSEYMIR